MAEEEVRIAEEEYSEAVLTRRALETQACGYLDIVGKMLSLGVPKNIWEISGKTVCLF